MVIQIYFKKSHKNVMLNVLKKMFVKSDISTKRTHILITGEKFSFIITCHFLIKETEKKGEKYI